MNHRTVLLVAAVVALTAGCRSMPSMAGAEPPQPVVITCIEYDPRSRVLTLQTGYDVVCQYQKVPPRVHRRLLAAASRTDYFLRHIRGRYPVTKIQGAIAK